MKRQYMNNVSPKKQKFSFYEVKKDGKRTQEIEIDEFVPVRIIDDFSSSNRSFNTNTEIR